MASSSTCYWSPNHVSAKEFVKVVINKHRFVYVDELSKSERRKFVDSARKLNETYHAIIEKDDLFLALKDEFNASLVIQQGAFDRAMKDSE